jgi:hypothetical protein
MLTLKRSKEVALGLANQIQTKTIKFGLVRQNSIKIALGCVALYKPAFPHCPIQTGPGRFCLSESNSS